jgi:hypothetical protein
MRQITTWRGREIFRMSREEAQEALREECLMNIELLNTNRSLVGRNLDLVLERPAYRANWWDKFRAFWA